VDAPASGPLALDGSPVDFYALLPPGDEPAIIHAALPSGCEILELGSGAGRVTHALLALGHRVVAVDQSAEMLAHVRGAETALADIETLDLGREFVGVTLGSHLVNTPNDAQRAAFLATCRRHLAEDGLALIERHTLEWATAVQESTVEVAGIQSTIRDIRREGTLFSAVMEYRLGRSVWTHPFTARILDDAELEDALSAAGLRFVRWLDAERRWVAASL
jgi:SAM-dependent methyltransferase